MATNVNAEVERIYAATPAGSAGEKIGYLADTLKGAQNDTITLTNVNTIIDADLRIVATGVAEPYTFDGNVLTLTSATTGSVRGKIYYK